MPQRLAIVTCTDLPDGDADDALLRAACERLGFEAPVLAWTQPDVDWAGFAAVVIRSTWDYADRREEFLAWASLVPRLFNPYSVIEGNTDKTYLRAISDAGLPIVPTTFVEPGQSIDLPTTGEFVVKPSIGAGSRGAGRFDLADPTSRAAAADHVAALQSVGRTVMVQPYQSDVDERGETAMIFIDGAFSHSIRKGAMLAPATRYDIDEKSLFIVERIDSAQPEVDELEVATAVMQHLSKRHGDLLYSRIDLLPGSSGPVVVEVELTEPSLFLGYADGAADRLAAAIASRAV